MKKLFTLNTIFVISIIASLSLFIIPLFTTTIPGTGDGFAHKFRAASFIKSLREGNIRPRWLADHAIGYGTPTLIYNFSLPYYAVAGINMFADSVEKSSQLYAAIIILTTFVSMYLFTNKLYGKNVGLVTAIAYVGAPLVLHSVYGWEAWGQMTAYFFPPLILYEALLLNEKVTLKKSVIFVITWILFINTHNVSALLAIPPLTVILLIFMEKTLRRLFFITHLFISACIISSFFWLPAIILSNWIKYKDLVVYHASVRQHELTKIQDYVTISLQTLNTGKTHFFSGTPGLLILSTIIISFVLFLTILYRKIVQHKNSGDKGLLYATALFLMTFISLMMTTDVSLPIWKTGIFDFILLYPSRFMFIVVFTGTLLFSWVIKKVTNSWILLVLCALIVVFARPFTNLKTTRFPFDDHYFENNVQLLHHAFGTWMNMGTEEFLPKWMNADFILQKQNIFFQTNNLPEKIEVDEKTGTALDQKVLSERMSFRILMDTDADVVINTAYYPNWTASINNKPVPVNVDSSGRLLIHVPKGENNLSVVFGYSSIEQFSFLVSFLGLIYLAILLRQLPNDGKKHHVPTHYGETHSAI